MLNSHYVFPHKCNMCKTLLRLNRNTSIYIVYVNRIETIAIFDCEYEFTVAPGKTICVQHLQQLLPVSHKFHTKREQVSPYRADNNVFGTLIT